MGTTEGTGTDRHRGATQSRTVSRLYVVAGVIRYGVGWVVASGPEAPEMQRYHRWPLSYMKRNRDTGSRDQTGGAPWQ